MILTKADIVRRLEDALAVFDWVMPEPTLAQELARAKVVALMLDVSKAEVSERHGS